MASPGPVMLPSDASPVAFQPRGLLVLVPVVHGCQRGQASCLRLGQEGAARGLCNTSASPFFWIFTRGRAAPSTSATQMNSLMGRVNLLFLVTFVRFIGTP